MSLVVPRFKKLRTLRHERMREGAFELLAQLGDRGFQFLLPFDHVRRRVPDLVRFLALGQEVIISVIDWGEQVRVTDFFLQLANRSFAREVEELENQACPVLEFQRLASGVHLRVRV